MDAIARQPEASGRSNSYAQYSYPLIEGIGFMALFAKAVKTKKH
jgi:hypothetical protein